jgi:hypothetical protein
MMFTRRVMLVALACALAAQGGQAANSRRLERRVRGDLTTCSGGIPKALQINVPICLRQYVSLAALPLGISLEDLEITSLNVTIANVPQSIRGARIDASTSSVAFTMVPETLMADASIETALKLEPKVERLAGYYDIVWYELEVVWPTFFGVADASVTQEVEVEEDEPVSETTFTPFPCTHFIGTLFCTDRTWLSG